MPPLSWPDALAAEFRALYGAAPLGPGASADPGERLSDIHARIHERGPSALCLSGGGIRSAIFALGVLQALAHVRVLGSLDYLSTVSGGGYVGGWLTAWLKREGPRGRADVLRALDPVQASTTPDGVDDTSPLERVRRTCRYLAPQDGVASADVWSLVTTMARNLLLNWLVIIPLLAAALLVPHIYYSLVHAVEQDVVVNAPCLAAGAAPVWFLAVGLACFAIGIGYTVANFVGFGGHWSQGRFLACFLAPVIAGAIAITLFWSSYPCALDLGGSILLSALLPAAGWVAVGVLARVLIGGTVKSDGSTLRVRVGLRTILAALLAGPVLGAGAYAFASYEFGLDDGLRQFYAAFAVPILLVLGIVAMMLFVGFASRELDDASIEWWSRAGGWLGIAATLWVTAGVVVFYLADGLDAALRAAAGALSVDHPTSSTIFAALVPLLSSLAGIAARRGSTGRRPSAVRAAVQAVALPLVIVLLLTSIAWADLRALEAIEYHLAGVHPVGAGLGESLMLFAGLVVLGVVMSWFVPVNRFSLHGMYRQRLIRTFLGASRPDRAPNAFTGFDANDDLRVHDLASVRPLHVINTTLNAVSSTHVGGHETEAQSFTFTPLHVGNPFVGYRPAPEYGSDGGGAGTGLSLGMALAVSGAAASSAMGMYSTAARAFLLTLANARLGLWFGNPQSAGTWRNSEPPTGVAPLLRELLGLTTDRNPYVYLSDGGHYENLGLWEMVARRCRFIIVSDAGCDPGYTFDDLSNAVRRIRLDLGVPIEFPPLPFTRAGQGVSNPHAAIGTIRYAAVDGPGAPDGTILYIKATLSGDEPVDVVNFARRDPTFPHDSTANQFFDEARFESYRALGFHSVLSVAAGLTDLGTAEALCATARNTLASARV